MFYERKTRDRNILKNFMFPAIVLLTFGVIWTYFGVSPAFYALGATYLLISSMPFITFWTTGNEEAQSVSNLLVFAGVMF